MLFRVEFAGLSEVRDRLIPLVGLRGGHPGVEGIVQLLVLLHRLFALFHLLFHLGLLLGRHAARSVLGTLRRCLRLLLSLALGGLRRLRRCTLLQIKIERRNITATQRVAANAIAVFSINFYDDVVLSHRQTGVQKVAFLVGFHLIVALDVGA